MKYHIVQVNERIQDIARKYHVTVDEIVKLNRHINNIDYIVPGMKIRLPVLSEEVSEELKDSFLDIDKYYPKVEDFKEVQIEKKTEEEGSAPEIESTPNVTPQNPYMYQNPYPQQYMHYIPQYYPFQPMSPYYNQMFFRDQQKSPQGQKYQVFSSVNQDLTIPQVKDAQKVVDSKFFDQPAFCDPILFTKYNETKCDLNKDYTQLFQSPLFNPPYPCGKEIPDIPDKHKELCLDENVKEIKVDLRDFVKKHTKISKKKDN